jgi:hypothetical protein
MRKLLLGIAACTLLACSDGKDKTPLDAGSTKADASRPDPNPDARAEDDAQVTEDDAAVDAAAPSALDRPPEGLERPPTRLPDDLRPPR